MYAKVFQQILDSSIVESPETRFTFMDMLILADFNGIVDMTHEAISRRTNRPLEIIRRTISELEGPDPRSRTPDHNGKRIERLDEHRDWGWRILNFIKFRDIKSQSERAVAFGYDVNRRGYIYFVSDSSNTTNVAIGFSTNPWSRFDEAHSKNPKLILVATKSGSEADFTEIVMRFNSLLISGDLYKFEGDLKEFVSKLRSNVRSSRSDRSSIQKQIQTQKQKEKTKTAFESFCDKWIATYAAEHQGQSCSISSPKTTEIEYNRMRRDNFTDEEMLRVAVGAWKRKNVDFTKCSKASNLQAFLNGFMEMRDEVDKQSQPREQFQRSIAHTGGNY